MFASSAILIRSVVIAAAALGIVALAQDARAAAFQNGSFESGIGGIGNFATLNAGDSTSITGWTVTGGGVDYIGAYWTARDGARSLDLNALEAGGVQQIFDTIIGQKYTVSFSIAGNTDGGPSLKSLAASAGSVVDAPFSFDITGHSAANPGWIDYSFDFFADSLLTTLSFESTTTADSGNGSYPHAFGPALDNVSVVMVAEVSEPATLAMLGMGLAGFGLLRRRRPA